VSRRPSFFVRAAAGSRARTRRESTPCHSSLRPFPGDGAWTPQRDAILLPRRPADSDSHAKRSGGRRRCYDFPTMSNRLIRLIGSALLAAAAASWSGVLSAQAPLKGSISRTPDGHPDLQGTFDVATLTPLQRPANVSKLVLTPQE